MSPELENALGELQLIVDPLEAEFLASAARQRARQLKRRPAPALPGERADEEGQT